MAIPLSKIVREEMVAEMGKYSFLYLLELKKDSDVFYLCNNTEELVINGNTYLPIPFTFSGLQDNTEGEFSEVTFSLDIPVNPFIVSLVSARQGLVDYEVNVMPILIDQNHQIFREADLDYENLSLDFLITNSTLNNDSFSLKCKHNTAITEPFPTRRYSLECPWVFKGAECKYNGTDENCNRTWADCVSKNNTKNFGGFVGLVRDALRYV